MVPGHRGQSICSVETDMLHRAAGSDTEDTGYNDSGLPLLSTAEMVI